MLGLVRTIGLFIVLLVALIFLVQNLATIEVAFLTWSFSAPRAVVFLLLFGAGVIAGYLLRALRPKRPTRRDAKGGDAERAKPSPAPE